MSSSLKKRNRGNPQDWIPRDCPDWTMAENPEQANIQRVGIHLEKLNTTKGQKPAVMDTSG